jgi:hypothetical protein
MRRTLIWKGHPATECSLDGTITGKMTVIAQNAEEMIVVTKTAGHMFRTSRGIINPSYAPVRYTVWKLTQTLRKFYWDVEIVCEWKGGGRGYPNKSGDGRSRNR